MPAMHRLDVPFARRSRFSCLACALALGTCLAALSATAQKTDQDGDLTGLSLERLMEIQVEQVYGASRHWEKVTEAPAVVTIVTADEIERFGYRTLADILNAARGFYTSYDRNYARIGVRGFNRPGDYNTRVLLLLDGRRLNDNVYDATYAETAFPLDLELIDRVEIIRGPSSSLYGTNAFFAVINVIPKRGAALRGLEFSTSSGTYKFGKGRATYGNHWANGAEALFSTSFYTNPGARRLFFPEFALPDTNNGYAERADDDAFRSLFASFTYRDFAFQGSYVTREKGIPTASYGTVFNDRRTRTIDSLGYLDLTYQHTFRSGWELMSRVGYDRMGYDGTYISDFGEGEEHVPIENRDLAGGQWLDAEIKLSRSLPARQKLMVGAEYRRDLQLFQTNYDVEPYYKYFDDTVKTRNVGVYIEDRINLTRYLSASVGVRHDSYHSFGGTTNPRIGLIFAPRQRSALKLLYGRAFRAPNNYEMYYAGYGSAANPDQRPEGISTYEVGLEKYIGKQTRVVASAYNYRIHDLISEASDPVDGLIYFHNAGAIRARGIEFAWERVGPRFLADLKYAFASTRDRVTGQPLTDSPRHVAKARLSVPFAGNRVVASLETQYVSRRRTLAEASVPAYALANVTLLARRLPGGMKASFSIYNLLDKRYGNPGAEEHRQDVLWQDGRTLRFNVSYSIQQKRR